MRTIEFRVDRVCHSATPGRAESYDGQCHNRLDVISLDSRRAIGYPTNRLLAVIDDPAEAAAALAELKAAGFADRDLEILRGEEGADRMDGTGEVSGWLGRLRRAFDFTLMDQLVDFATYERALRDGRAVVMVHVHGDAPKATGARDPASATAATSSTTTAGSPPRSSTCGAGPSRTSRATSAADDATCPDRASSSRYSPASRCFGCGPANEHGPAHREPRG